jgi:N-hydroxyarylamine O-acetyltransferase
MAVTRAVPRSDCIWKGCRPRRLRHDVRSEAVTTPTVDLDAYMRRIGYAAPYCADRPTLAALIAAHASAIPFENLEVLAGRVPSLKPLALQRKLVDAGRGGYCFEQNLLFLAVLRQIGFGVRPLEARVRANVSAEAVTGRTHMALEVCVDDEVVLADVGFGGLAPLVPVSFDGRPVRSPDGTLHRLLHLPDATALQIDTGHGWEDCYHIGPGTPQVVDLEIGNWYVATHPSATLGCNLLVARFVDGGRLTLFNRRLTFRRASTSTLQEQDISSPTAVDKVLSERFGLAIDAADLQRALAKLQPLG